VGAVSILLVVALVIVSAFGLLPGIGPHLAEEEPPVLGSIDVVGDPEAEGLLLYLPTRNDALLHGVEPAFYMGLDATVPDLRPELWMGGQYGFVRNVAQTPAGPTFTRVHQGVDIRPMYRDAESVPLDTVRVIDDGIVVYILNNPGGSNYGRYVVVQHTWDESGVYSLYAHLDSVWVERGAHLASGTPIGRMGYSGQGLHRGRAHLHLEVAFMASQHFDLWNDAFHGTENIHGLYIGRNFVGIDPAEMYLEIHDNPDLTFAEFVRSRPVGYRIAIPGEYPLDLFERHPWLGADGVSPADAGPEGSWVVGFTREGVPVEIDRQDAPVPVPQVVYVKDEVRRDHLSTAGYLVREDDEYRLTRAGLGYAALLATTPDGVPAWF
jgi:hypothetical protein